MRIMLATICCRFRSWGLVKKLIFCSDSEHKVWSRCWSWSSSDILKLKFDQYLCLNLWYYPKGYFGKMNSTLGSVVPLAIFENTSDCLSCCYGLRISVLEARCKEGVLKKRMHEHLYNVHRVIQICTIWYTVETHASLCGTEMWYTIRFVSQQRMLLSKIKDFDSNQPCV